MTLEELITRFRVITEKEEELLTKKGADYSGGEDAFGNFKRIADFSRGRLTSKQAAFTLLMKHIDAIARHVFEGKLSAESFESHIIDARNYLFLLLMMTRED